MEKRYYYKDEKDNLYNYKTPRKGLIPISENLFKTLFEPETITETQPKIDEKYLRSRREVECFSIINRGKLWYDKLSEYELAELDEWYNAWLNVTQTYEIPEKPYFLRSEENEDIT